MTTTSCGSSEPGAEWPPVVGPDEYARRAIAAAARREALEEAALEVERTEIIIGAEHGRVKTIKGAKFGKVIRTLIDREGEA